jgi:hypothetical protein
MTTSVRDQSHMQSIIGNHAFRFKASRSIPRRVCSATTDQGHAKPSTQLSGTLNTQSPPATQAI